MANYTGLLDENIRKVLSDYQLPATAKLIYIVLSVHADKEGNCYLPNRDISQILGGITSCWIAENLKALRERGYIQATYKGRGGRGKHREIQIKENLNG